MDKNAWPKSLRWIHLGLAVGITFQLFSRFQPVLRLDRPFFLPAHLYNGLWVFLLILVFWMVAARTPGMMRHLFPYSAVGLRKVAAGTLGLLRGRLPESGMVGGLPGLVEGLGMVAVTIMVISGVSLFILVREGEPFAVFSQTLQAFVHVIVSKAVWAYWIGHVLMAIVHGTRHPRVLRIFAVWDR